MKHLLITTIAAVLLVGCGETQQSAPEPEVKAVEPAAEAATPEPTAVKAPDISVHKAAALGDIEVVKQFLDSGTDVNAKDETGGTPLDEAAGWGRNDIVELLIAKGADVNAKFDDDGSTPLHLSAWRGHFETAELLIAAGSEVNAKMEDGDTPLDLAEKESRRDSPQVKAAKKEIAALLRKHGGKTGGKSKNAGK